MKLPAVFTAFTMLLGHPLGARDLHVFDSVNGADSGDTRAMGWDKLIRPLGEGSFDNAKLLRLLDDVGFKGPVVLQCYNLKQPAAAHLAISMAGWHRLAGGD